jgi:hypothetical protein
MNCIRLANNWRSQWTSSRGHDLEDDCYVSVPGRSTRSRWTHARRIFSAWLHRPDRQNPIMKGLFSNFTISKLVIPRIPRTSYPCWAVVNVYDYEYIDHECHATSSTIRITFFPFPVLLGFISGP